MIVLLLAATASADGPLKELLAFGHIDWTKGTVKASGIGCPGNLTDDRPTETPLDSLDTARQMARKKLLDTISAIRINSNSRIVDRMSRDETFRDGLIAMVNNAAITRQEYLSDGTVEIVLSMKLTGGFAQYVLPEEIRQVDPVTTMPNAKTPAPPPAPAPAGQMDSKAYTGLVVDASGIGAAPALVPVIVDESGVAIYGPAFVSREFAVSRGMSGYATSQAEARECKRVGDNPMVIRAIRTHASGITDLVIPNTDAARLRSSAIHLDFLKACRVCIVISPSTGG